jgi:hypothetical protein
MRVLVRMTALAVVAIGATGCARLHARTAPAGPPLEAPAPPLHVISAVEEASVVEPPPVVADLPVRPTPRAPTPAPAAAAPKPERADPAPAAPASPPPADATPSRTLQTTANVEAVERKIRSTLTDASRALGRIDYRGLSVDGKAQYDIAKRFVEQAEQALVAKNLLFASQLADKASALATLLTR